MTKVPRTVTEKETQRYKLLRYAGFLSLEAIALMNESFATPHMKGLIKERNQRLEKIVRGGGSEKDYELSIHQAYVDNKWQSLGKTGEMEDDPSKMLEDAKRKYKAKEKNNAIDRMGRPR